MAQGLGAGQGDVRLIDPDSMHVPGCRAPAPSLVGHPGYNHPGRSADHHGPTIDRFARMIIDTTLALLVADPTLWGLGGRGDDREEGILFVPSDLRDPDASELFRRLRSSHDPAVRALGIRIESALRVPVGSTPPCVRDQVQATGRSWPAPAWCTPVGSIPIRGTPACGTSPGRTPTRPAAAPAGCGWMHAFLPLSEAKRRTRNGGRP